MPVQPEYEHLDMGNQNNIANTEYAKLTPTDSVTNRTAAESEEVNLKSGQKVEIIKCLFTVRFSRK